MFKKEKRSDAVLLKNGNFVSEGSAHGVGKALPFGKRTMTNPTALTPDPSVGIV